MSNRKTAEELIDRLYQTEYSPEEFEKQLLIKQLADDNQFSLILSDMKKFVSGLIEEYDSSMYIDDMVD